MEPSTAARSSWTRVLWRRGGIIARSVHRLHQTRTRPSELTRERALRPRSATSRPHVSCSALRARYSQRAFPSSEAERDGQSPHEVRRDSRTSGAGRAFSSDHRSRSRWCKSALAIWPQSLPPCRSLRHWRCGSCSRRPRAITAKPLILPLPCSSASSRASCSCWHAGSAFGSSGASPWSWSSARPTWLAIVLLPGLVGALVSLSVGSVGLDGSDHFASQTFMKVLLS